MRTSTINVRVDTKTRKDLKKFAAEVGVPTSSLIHASIRQMLRTRAVSFTTELSPTPYVQELVKKAQADFKAGKRITSVSDKEELDAYLRAL
jgi:antitoxin component of RelBE/YafQ-DinJ toxin-antitoxin module